MVDEIESHLENAVAGADRGRGKAACGHIERDVPRVVDPGRLYKAHLADDLRPEMERLARVFPRRKRKAGPGAACQGCTLCDSDYPCRECAAMIAATHAVNFFA